MVPMEYRSIPEELIINEILTRLPVKSLLRFRSVCKAWHSTISKRDFIETHRYHSQSKVHVVHFSDDIPQGTGSINIECLTEDGLLQHYHRLPWLQKYQLRSFSNDLVVFPYKDAILLSNLSMQESVYLPHPTSWFDALLPVKGFGFVSSLGKYKVVLITSGIVTQGICEVFTVGTDNSWRIGKTPPSSIDTYGHTPYVNRNLHKLTRRNDKDGNSKILLFNLENETWTMMKLPDHPQCHIYRHHTELREIECLLCFTCCIQNKSIDIWMLRDYANEVWSKDFVIDMTLPRVMPDGVNFRIYEFYGWFPLNVIADGRILLHMESIVDDRWFYYDPRDGSIQLADHKGRDITIYAENLVPICGF
ncbi:unnamed protein product [Alopecurus aequalis]